MEVSGKLWPYTRWGLGLHVAGHRAGAQLRFLPETGADVNLGHRKPETRPGLNSLVGPESGADETVDVNVPCKL